MLSRSGIGPGSGIPCMGLPAGLPARERGMIDDQARSSQGAGHLTLLLITADDALTDPLRGGFRARGAQRAARAHGRVAARPSCGDRGRAEGCLAEASEHVAIMRNAHPSTITEPGGNPRQSCSTARRETQSASSRRRNCAPFFVVPAASYPRPREKPRDS